MTSFPQSTMSFDVTTATAESLLAGLSSGTLNSVTIIQQYLRQIAKHNHAGLKLNAVISVAPEASLLAQAGVLDEERRNGILRGKLHGLPIMVKDCFLFARELGLKTTAGADCFRGCYGKKNAAVIQQMIYQGLIILGTANLTEFCGHKAKEMTPGWSAVGGQTQSAFHAKSIDEGNPNRNPESGGSSAGSAVCISAGFTPLSLGTETGGSLVYPASKSGLYAIRPTLGSVSGDGVFHISKSFDGVGGMARTPSDLALIIESILTPEARSSIPLGGYTGFLSGSWEGIKCGFLPSGWGADPKKWDSPEIKSRYEGAVDSIRAHGGHVVYPVDLAESRTLKTQDGLDLRTIAYHEFNERIQTFSACMTDSPVGDLESIIAYNSTHALTTMAPPCTDQEALIESLGLGTSLTDEASSAGHAILRKMARDALEVIMTTHDLDLIVGNSDCPLISYSSCSGWPSSTVPLGNMEGGFPYGLFLIARGGREGDILDFMSAFERTFPKIKDPSAL